MRMLNLRREPAQFSELLELSALKNLESTWLMKLGGGEWEAQFVVIYLIDSVASVTTTPSILCQQENSVVWEKYCNNL